MTLVYRIDVTFPNRELDFATRAVNISNMSKGAAEVIPATANQRVPRPHLPSLTTHAPFINRIL